MSRYFSFFSLLFIVTLLSTSISAAQLPISSAQLERLLNHTDGGESGKLRSSLAEAVRQALERLEPVSGMELPPYRFEERDVVLEERCESSSVIRQIAGEIRLGDGSHGTLDMVTLAQPATLSLALKAHLVATGTVDRSWGLEAFGGCNRYAEYGFDFDAEGDLGVRLDATITPEIEVVEGGIRYAPILAVRVAVDQVSYDVTVDDELFASLVERKIREAIRPYLDQAAGTRIAQDLERQFRHALIDSWGADYIVIPTPGLDVESPADLQDRFAQAYERRGVYLQNNLGSLSYLLLSNNDKAWGELLDDTALCEASEYLMADMASDPLYRFDGVQCRKIEAPYYSREGDYYSDDACQQMLHYRPMSVSEQCSRLADSAPSSAPVMTDREAPGSWYLSPLTRLDIGVDSIAANHHPYTSSRIYKRVSGERGECALEMQIHKRSVGDEGLRPLLMLHGGSWERRRNGLVGAVSQVSHYTEQGFVVFVPTYRLVGEVEGDPACNGVAGEQIVADVTDALSWVVEHGAEYGVAPGGVAVVGQSAGGHLALRLAVEHPERISGMLLLYPATDFGYFLDGWRTGRLGVDPDGLKALQEFVGVPLDTVPLTDGVIARNSIPPQIAGRPAIYPPMFIVHGSADSLVPVSQSVRLCNALSGDLEHGPAESIPWRISEGRSRTYRCDRRGSQLHIVTAAEHMLDGCLLSLICPAGDVENQALVRRIVRQGREWLFGESSAQPLEARTGEGGR